MPRKYKSKYRKAKRNHGRSGEQDLRGNSAARKARKLWMLRTFGNGKTVKCTHCGKKLDYATVTSDRKIPGCLGGRYTHANVQPACKPCNDKRNTFICPLTDDQMERERERREMDAAFGFNPRRRKPKSRFKPAKRRSVKILKRRRAA